jgi:hypothetical protein
MISGKFILEFNLTEYFDYREYSRGAYFLKLLMPDGKEGVGV